MKLGRRGWFSNTGVLITFCIFWMSAHAAVYQLTFGGSGVSLSAQIQLDPSCLGANGWQASDPYTYDPYDYKCSASVSSAKLSLDSGGPDAQTVDFAGLLPDPKAVVGVNVVDGQLAGLDSYLIGSVYVPAGAFNGYYWLQFDSGTGHGVGPIQPPVDPVFVFHNSSECIVGCQSAPSLRIVELASVTQVPEPASWSLILAALGAVWLVRRRRI